MSTLPVDIAPADAAASRFDIAVEALMIALLAFMPLAFGAVEAWSELVVVLLAGAMAGCLALKLIWRRDVKPVWTWAYVPVVLFVALALFQLVALPASVVKIISPHSAAVRADLLGDLPDAPRLLNRMTLSLYPLATEHDLRLILAAAAVFVIIVNVYRRPEQIKRLLAAVAAIGGGLALLALAQDLFGNDKIYWVVPAGEGKASSGTFINHSHYGQFMNLSIGAALGLLLVKLDECFRHRNVALPEVITHLSNPALRVVWYLAGMIILGAATMFISLTRGGIVSMLIAGGFTAVVLAGKRNIESRGWIIAALAMGSFACVLYIGFDAVYDRLATLRDLHHYENRWGILKDLSVSVTKFPTVGTGLGTHEVVYPMFDRSTIPALAAHAENEYAQAAEETGVVGLALILAFAAIVWRAYLRNVRSLRLPIHSEAFGLGFGLLAIMVHSFSDFGQHLPANACLTAVCCGLLVGMAPVQPGTMEPANPTGIGGSGGRSNPGRWARGLRIGGGALVVAVWLWSLTGANDARRAETHWEQALRIEGSLREKDWLGSNEEYDAILSHAAAAADYQPRNVKYRHWLNVYRWEAISRVTDPDTGEIVMTPQSLEFTERVVDDLHRARELCPTFGATYCVAGQLEKFILEQPVGADHIRTGFRLAPCDATACFVTGLLDAQEGQMEASEKKFRRALELDGRLIADVIDVYVYQVGRPDLAVAIARDNIGWLSRVARTLSETTEHEELAADARKEAVELLRARCDEPDAPAWALASLADAYWKEQDCSAAADCFRRALDLDYGQVYWRLSLARVLVEMDRVPEAIHEARIVLRLRPHMVAARKLIEELSVRPGATGESG